MKNRLYNLIIFDVTEHCYENCLNYFPDHSKILDVGIGNGSMLKKYHHLIKSKGLKLTGIDVNKTYINHCDRLIRTYQLEHHIEIYNESVEAFEPPKKKYFDFILFSMSFMLFNNQGLVLDRIKDYLKPGGEIVFFKQCSKRS
jgi:alpha-N-acetylglucosaminidase